MASGLKRYDRSTRGWLEDIAYDRALLCLSDFAGPGLDASPLFSLGIGLSNFADGTGEAGTFSGVNGELIFRTLATIDSQIVVATENAVAHTDFNPECILWLNASAADADMKVSGWGFVPSVNASDWTTVGNQKAMFRQVTTGALFAVSSDGSSEETTDVSAFYTLTNHGSFEIRVSSGKVEFYIGRVLVATHTTNPPQDSAAMHVAAGIENVNAANVQFTVDFLGAHQDRDFNI